MSATADAPQPSEDQIGTLRDNYLRGAIDLMTFLMAVEDIWDGVPNSYGQAAYGDPDE